MEAAESDLQVSYVFSRLISYQIQRLKKAHLEMSGLVAGSIPDVGTRSKIHALRSIRTNHRADVNPNCA